MQKDFSLQLIKGKIAELIFFQMFREAKEFTIIPFGYEQTLPELAQYVREGMHSPVLEGIRNAPDFALVSHNQKEVFLVEVKFRAKIHPDQILKIAQEVHEKWKLAYLFVASPEEFYFDSCHKIIEKVGMISPLSSSWIDKESQAAYLKLLNHFIRADKDI